MSFKAFSRDSDNNILLPTKSKRSQSALEYMMTYGWAILIIVIVAVILYSMGIFNPSSSITFTSSGFSPFTISSVICSQDGLSFSVLAGPMPNGAYSMSVNSFYIVSSSGTNTSRISYTLSSPITLTSGKTGVIAVPNVVCPSAGTKVSMSANLEYSYSTTAGKVVTNTTGTLAGTATHGPTLPAGIEYYSQLTVSNSQSTATPSPFQQMVNFTSSDPDWTSISTSNFGQNVEFFYYNGTVIPSWLENYTSSHALWWLKIAAIPAGSSETVYVGFAPTSTNLFNTVNDGEAPQLSSTYAEYDDGANVFNSYWNFAGTTLSSGWSTSDSGGITISNGVQINAGSVYTTSVVFNSLNDVEEMYSKYTSLNSGNYAGITQSNSQAPEGGNTGSNAEILWITNSGSNEFYVFSANGVSSNYNLQNSIPSEFIPNLNQYYVIGSFVSNNIVGEQVNYNTLLKASGTFSTSQYIILGFFGGSSSGTTPINPIFVQWVRVRAYPPNGIMPSVSFGSLA